MNMFLSESNDIDREYRNVEDRGHFYRYKVTLPNFCPYENKPSKFEQETCTLVDTYYLKRRRKFNQNFKRKHFAIVFRCLSCHQYCLFNYDITQVANATHGGKTIINNQAFRRNHLDTLFSDHDFNKLNSVSPKFEGIYYQALEAENMHLDKIDVMAYRKALEFLVNGYLVSIDKPTNGTLGAKIQRMSDKELVYPAQLGAWIGNDGTHPNTQNPELGINDIKYCLSAVGHFIVYKLIAKDAKKYIQKRNAELKNKNR